MPQEEVITRAVLKEIGWSDDWEPVEVPRGKELKVQFNPQTLKVSFANNMSGGDQRGGSSIQFVGKGTTKLSLDLLFDVTAPLADGQMQPQGDVRFLTRDVAYFLMPQREAPGGDGQQSRFVPPGVRLTWGSFVFEGVMESMNESLELFSAEGKPLRATVSVGLARQDIFFPEVQERGGAGTQPRIPTREGDSLQQIAGRQGQTENWQALAAGNNVENPRHIPPGTLLDPGVAASGQVRRAPRRVQRGLA